MVYIHYFHGYFTNLVAGSTNFTGQNRIRLKDTIIHKTLTEHLSSSGHCILDLLVIALLINIALSMESSVHCVAAAHSERYIQSVLPI